MTTPQNDDLFRGGHTEVVTLKGAAALACDHHDNQPAPTSSNTPQGHVGGFRKGSQVDMVVRQARGLIESGEISLAVAALAEDGRHPCALAMLRHGFPDYAVNFLDTLAPIDLTDPAAVRHQHQRIRDDAA